MTSEERLRLLIARELGYRFLETFVIPPDVYADNQVFWDAQGVDPDPLAYCNLNALPDWLTDMGAAWTLAEAMRESGLNCVLESRAENHWRVCFQNESCTIQESADTLPMAISKAWLKWYLGIELNQESAIS